MLSTVYPKDKILDLVTPQTQDMNKSLLFDRPDFYSVVIACRLFDEGTDWVPCSRLHNTDAGEKSLTLAVQRFYRPLRQHPEKTTVKLQHYLPTFTEEMTADDQRIALSSRFNAILACAVMQGELLPTLIPCKREGLSGRQRISLQEVYGDKYQSVMRDLLKEYELIPDKSDSAKMEQLADKLLEEYGTPEIVDREKLRIAILTHILRLAAPKSLKSDFKSVQVAGCDGEDIRRSGFDKIWKKTEVPGSALCWGTDSISWDTIRELLTVAKTVPTLDEIRLGVKQYQERTGTRITRTNNHCLWIDELESTTNAMDKICHRHHGTTLAKEIKAVNGESPEQFIERVREVIKDYWSRDIRLGNKYGPIPELGMTSFAVNGRLNRYNNTTLAKEVATIVGPLAAPLTIGGVRQVIGKYLRRGKRLHRKVGYIPELSMTSYNLDDRLHRNHGIRLGELVNEVAMEMGA